MPSKKIISIFLFVLLLLSACRQNSATKFVELKINGQPVKAEVALTLAQQTRGLSRRDYLPPDQGMLFVFNKSFLPVFWMKGMRFPLDIIWIKDNFIVQITSNIQPPRKDSSKLKRYRPKQAVNYVLELNAGWANKHKLRVGQKIEGLPLVL